MIWTRGYWNSEYGYEYVEIDGVYLTVHDDGVIEVDGGNDDYYQFESFQELEKVYNVLKEKIRGSENDN